MSKEKQISEMARTMCFQRESCTVKSCIEVNCEKTWLAEALYNAGYRKASDVAREIFEEIEKETEIGQIMNACAIVSLDALAELKKKYTESEEGKWQLF